MSSSASFVMGLGATRVRGDGSKFKKEGHRWSDHTICSGVASAVSGRPSLAVSSLCRERRAAAQERNTPSGNAGVPDCACGAQKRNHGTTCRHDVAK